MWEGSMSMSMSMVARYVGRYMYSIYVASSTYLVYTQYMIAMPEVSFSPERIPGCLEGGGIGRMRRSVGRMIGGRDGGSGMDVWYGERV
jgi:hypothetical protein